MARTLELDSALERLIEDQLRTGRFADERAVVEAGLHLLADRSAADRLGVEDIRLSIAESRHYGTLSDADAVFDAAMAVARGRPE